MQVLLQTGDTKQLSKLHKKDNMMKKSKHQEHHHPKPPFWQNHENKIHQTHYLLLCPKNDIILVKMIQHFFFRRLLENKCEIIYPIFNLEQICSKMFCHFVTNFLLKFFTFYLLSAVHVVPIKDLNWGRTWPFVSTLFHIFTVHSFIYRNLLI